jgi:L-2-hydroxyglutarate oxidase
VRIVAEVIVAGAGIVGLATAYELTRRGHAVTVL